MSGIPVDVQSSGVADALTLADFSKPSSDVSNSQFQDAVASSLLSDDESVRPMSSFDIDSASDERIQEEWPNEQADFAEESAEVEQEEPEFIEFDDEHNAILDEAEAWQQQQAAAQQAEANRPLTPAELNAGIQELGERADAMGINDLSAAQKLAYELSVPFGGAPDAINPQALGSVMSKTVLSAVDILQANNGDISNLGAIPPAAAQAFTNDLLSSMGVDARMVNVDSGKLASVVLGATINTIDTLNRSGIDARPESINDPQVAEWFLGALYQVFGINGPVNRQEALHVADSFTRYVQSGLRQASARQAQQQQRPQQPRRSSARRTFESNNDIFGDREVLERIRMERL